ncbi:TIGR03560 family F420-dependent LLM class oxidoreductase [Actinophytocola sp.]|uniref:TIGR03560 family F420-dependent LLM class oxidoreductase n=1 Tax=Actinophytocola sp. TaxID=1872138 RepID=UPI003D6B26A5
MRVSISLSDYTWPGGPAAMRDHLGALVRAADAAGVHTLWLPDHVIQADPRKSPDAEMLETYTTLGFIAARTERMRLGAMVTPVSYRSPAVVVKAVTTLDVLSGGRAWFGIGAGYSEGEAKGMGLDFPPTAERFERLTEALEIAFQMWSGDTSPYEGTHYRLENPISSPPPLGRPHPPVLVGGTGEKKTLRLVAEYADACNLSDLPDQGATIRRKLDVLERHCADVGRPFGDIDKTASTLFLEDETPDAFARRCGVLAGYGVEHLVLFHSWTVESLEALGKLIPAAAEV